MASLTKASRLALKGVSRKAGRPCVFCRTITAGRSLFEEAPPAPPLLLKLRNDLKSAMKQKDTNRLAVLRSVLAEVTNASKTKAGPPKTDLQVVSLLRKQAQASADAAKQFEDGGRNDLKEKEDVQGLILEEYAASVQTMSEEEVDGLVRRTVREIEGRGETVNKGSLMRHTVGPGGSFEGKTVENQVVSRKVDEVLKNL